MVIMKSLLVLTLITIISGYSMKDNEQWQLFKKTHNKNYKNINKENLRYKAFQNNLEKIQEHNARYQKGEVSYYLGINQYADLTQEEFGARLGSYSVPSGDIKNINRVNDEPAEKWDWRNTPGIILPVEDQGDCNVGFIFAAVGSVEAINAYKHNISKAFSKQEVLDCHNSTFTISCNGGTYTAVWEYIRKFGIRSEFVYPYEGVRRDCRRGNYPTEAIVEAWGETVALEEALQGLTQYQGPVVVTIDGASVQLYAGGIFDGPCFDDENHRTQSMLAVGWDSDNGVDYWILKNSWGVQWGEEGYIRLKRNPSVCGLLTVFYYVDVA